MPAWKWLLIKFSTRAHFMRAIATVILAVGAYELVRNGKISDSWLGLVGMVVGYYFKGEESKDDGKDPDTEALIRK